MLRRSMCEVTVRLWVVAVAMTAAAEVGVGVVAGIPLLKQGVEAEPSPPFEDSTRRRLMWPSH